VTTLTDGLEERGLAERRPLPRPPRKTVALTESGLATLARDGAAFEPPVFLDALKRPVKRHCDRFRKIASVDRPLERTQQATRYA
jgi:DNA-binding PadR family transcriptional regulator